MKTLSLALLLCLFAAAPVLADPANSGVPSIDELQKQLDQKKAASKTPKKHRKSDSSAAAPATAPEPAPEDKPRAAREEPGDDKVRIAATIPYATDDGGPFDVGADCKWTDVLLSSLQRHAGGKVAVAGKELERTGGKTLKLSIGAIHTSGGGAFSGRKWATLRGELRQDGQLLHRFQMTKSSTTDPFRFSSCSVANKLADKLGESAADWLKHPSDLSEPMRGAKDKAEAPRDDGN